VGLSVRPATSGGRCASRTRDPTPPPAAPWPPDPPPPSGHDRPEHVRKRPVVHAPLTIIGA
jgi:hypothetical protein